jgi:hypothetical protein
MSEARPLVERTFASCRAQVEGVARAAAGAFLVSGSLLQALVDIIHYGRALRHGYALVLLQTMAEIFLDAMIAGTELRFWVWVNHRAGLFVLDPASDDETARAAICPVCRDSLEQPDVARFQCWHCFHRNCIRNWSRKSYKCPLCSRDMWSG